MGRRILTLTLTDKEMKLKFTVKMYSKDTYEKVKSVFNNV